MHKLYKEVYTEAFFFDYLLYESDSESDTNQLFEACQNLDGSEILT